MESSTKIKPPVSEGLYCAHCGEPCGSETIRGVDNCFCCEGCRLVFELLNQHGLCNYYELNDHPGINRRIPVREGKFAFLDDGKVAGSIVKFRSEEQTHVQFYLPAIHCSSCLFLLENLPRLDAGIISARIDFPKREISLVFDERSVRLRQVAELLSSLGYEPYISLQDMGGQQPGADRSMIYRLGVAGFCFANIMLLSFPEYLGLNGTERSLEILFHYLGMLLAIPVLLYSAHPFYSSAWKGMRHRYLNIDAPIVLAIMVTFGRGLWEVLSGAGAGYFDSMSGIVFFMLAGRALQDRTYRQLTFERDYQAYFPIAVTLAGKDQGVKPLPEIVSGDVLRIHNGELIPADGILTAGAGLIDYSFVTGESLPVERSVGELIYAGGRQTGGAIELLVTREVAQSYLTQLWDKAGAANRRKADGEPFSFVHGISRWFTVVVLGIALGARIYWQLVDPAVTWKAVTAVLIIACPCALLLSSTFTNGNILRILGRNQFYLRNGEVIERIARASHIVFDKTGTLTEAGSYELIYQGSLLSAGDRQAIFLLASQSSHPLSRSIRDHLQDSLQGESKLLAGFDELPGKGITASIQGQRWIIGSRGFVLSAVNRPADSMIPEEGANAGSSIYIACNGRLKGIFRTSGHYREGIGGMVTGLPRGTKLSVLSGDNGSEAKRLQQLLGKDARLLFDQSPAGKAAYVKKLQENGERVMMVGDGLNDAGALRQSDAGIAVAADCNYFTPACDAILQADRLYLLPMLIRLCRSGRKIIIASFIISIIYNIIGLLFAVQGYLSPMIAAILMPASSITILMVTYGSSNILALRLLGSVRKIIPAADKGQVRRDRA